MAAKFYDLDDFVKKIEQRHQIDPKISAFLNSLDVSDKASLFFSISILKDPESISTISKSVAATGYSQQNLPFPGMKGTPGDEIVLNRWRKAASGSIIMPTRYNADGELEVLFGMKRGQGVDVDYWALPGGHFELDQHTNLEHALVAELIEETGIIPLIDEFRSYVEKTIADEKDKLPYNSIGSAPNNYISRDLVWDLVTIISGYEANITKHSINAGYRMHFNDGAHLKPEGNDDLGVLKWFKLSEIEFGDEENYPVGMPIKENRVYLSSLLMGQGKIIEVAVRKIRAWEFCSILSKNAAIEDFDFFIQHLHNLRHYAGKIEKVYQLPQGELLRNCLVGSKYNEYIDRALLLHKMLPQMREEADKMLAGEKVGLNSLIEQEFFDKFGIEY